MCTPISLYLSWCFAEGMSFLRQKQWVSSRKRWEKQKLDYVNIVWKWCDQIPTWWNQTEITAVRENECPILQMARWAPPIFSEKGTHENHIWSTPCLLQSHEFCSSLSSVSVTIQFSATFLNVSWPAFCQLELRFFPPSFLCNSRIICTYTFII